MTRRIIFTRRTAVEESAFVRDGERATKTSSAISGASRNHTRCIQSGGSLISAVIPAGANAAKSAAKMIGLAIANTKRTQNRRQNVLGMRRIVDCIVGIFTN